MLIRGNLLKSLFKKWSSVKDWIHWKDISRDIALILWDLLRKNKQTSPLQTKVFPVVLSPWVHEVNSVQCFRHRNAEMITCFVVTIVCYCYNNDVVQQRECHGK
jgi:hypothetical protein